MDAGDAVNLETRDAVHLVVRGTEPREDEVVAGCEPGNNTNRMVKWNLL